MMRHDGARKSKSLRFTKAVLQIGDASHFPTEPDFSDCQKIIGDAAVGKTGDHCQTNG